MSAPLNVARVGHGVVAAGGFLFVVGGTTTLKDNSTKALASTEKFDGKSWQVVTPMTTARVGPAVASTGGGGFIAAGGCGEETPCASVEMFDVESGTWSAAPALGTARTFAAGAAGATGAFVMGGQVVPTGKNPSTMVAASGEELTTGAE